MSKAEAHHQGMDYPICLGSEQNKKVNTIGLAFPGLTARVRTSISCSQHFCFSGLWIQIGTHTISSQAFELDHQLSWATVCMVRRLLSFHNHLSKCLLINFVIHTCMCIPIIGFISLENTDQSIQQRIKISNCLNPL